MLVQLIGPVPHLSIGVGFQPLVVIQFVESAQKPPVDLLVEGMSEQAVNEGGETDQDDSQGQGIPQGQAASGCSIAWLVPQAVSDAAAECESVATGRGAPACGRSAALM